jgi:uncharacterized protein
MRLPSRCVWGGWWYYRPVALPLLLSVASVGIGALIGLAPGVRARSWTGPARTFAFVAALALALGELLPEALAAGGLATVLVFALGWGLPMVLERHSRRAGHGGRSAVSRWGLEAGYVGLLVHKLGDGLALGAAMAPGFGGSRLSLAAAMAAHSIPVAALVAVAYQNRDGLRAAVVRVAGLAAAMALGAAAVGVLSAGPPPTWMPWISAAVAGTLMHIVVHGWRVPSPTTWPARAMEVAAVAAGLLIVLMPWATHGADHAFRESVAHHGLDIALDTAPALLIGLLIAAALQAWGSRLPVRWLTGGRPLGQAARGALLGLPLPVCACGVLPMAHSLRGRGATPAFVLAFLVATPELGVETLALTARFFGWPFAIVRLLAAVAVAFVAGMAITAAIRRFGGPVGATPMAQPCSHPSHGHEGHHHDALADGATAPFLARAIQHFDDLFRHIGPWAFVGILAAAYTAAALPPHAFGASLGGGLDVALMTAIAIPSYVCASSATPLAAVLLAKGMSPGAVLTGLLLGPATNLATVGWLRSAYGARATVWAVGALIATVWALAFAVNMWMPGVPVVAGDPAAHAHGWPSHAAALLLVLLLVRAIGRNGLRTWLGALGESLSPAASGSAAPGVAAGPPAVPQRRSLP